MRRPDFISYLGPNAEPIARQLGEQLTDALGIDLRCPGTASWSDVETAIDADSVGLVWMCGLVTTRLIDSGRLDAEIVAAPVFPGEPGPTYHGVVIARADERAPGILGLAGSALAINETTSWSGYHALRVHLAEAGRTDAFFGSVTETGSHDGSIDRVLAGVADCAVIDSSVWDHRVRRDPRLHALRVVVRTRDWPAPPFALSRRLNASLRAAITELLVGSLPDGLDRIVPAGSADYDSIRRGMLRAERVAW